MVFTKLKNKVQQLVEALNGRVRAHHRQMMRMHLDHLQYVEKQIEELETKIDKLLHSRHEAVELLMTIPGVKEDVAASILAEIGDDMSHFPTDAHLASWAGVSPGNNESAGKKKHTNCQRQQRIKSCALTSSLGSK